MKPLVLVIEDDPQIRRFLRATLTAEDYQFHEALTAAEGIAQAAARQPDLILLDIGIPNLNGIEAAKRIREVDPGTRIVFLTQNSDKDVIRAALGTGAQGYVLKTDAGAELLPAVAAVLGGDVFVSSGIKRELPCDAEEW